MFRSTRNEVQSSGVRFISASRSGKSYLFPLCAASTARTHDNNYIHSYPIVPGWCDSPVLSVTSCVVLDIHDKNLGSTIERGSSSFNMLGVIPVIRRTT